jgi:hypothetical protein
MRALSVIVCCILNDFNHFQQLQCTKCLTHVSFEGCAPRCEHFQVATMKILLMLSLHNVMQQHCHSAVINNLFVSDVLHVGIIFT